MPVRISKLEKAQRQNPGVPLFARVADEHLRRGRVSRALTLCQEGCERFPDYPTGFLLLGRCYQARGNFEKARNLFGLALRLDPENAAGFAALSAAYEQLGDITLALQCMRQAAFLDPYSEGLYREAERLRRRAAAAPLVLPPGPAVAPKVEGSRVEAGTGAVPPPEAGREPPLSTEPADIFSAQPDSNRRGPDGEPPREDTEDGGVPVPEKPAITTPERESPPDPPPPEGPTYPGDLAGTNQEVPGNEDVELLDSVEAPGVHSREESGVPEPEKSLSLEDPPAPSADSNPVAPPSGETEDSQTSVFYLVSEPGRVAPDTGTGDRPGAWSEAEFEPDAPLPASPEAGPPDALGSDNSAPDDPGSGQPVAWLSSREDRELIGLFSEIRTGEMEGTGPASEAGGVEETAPVPTATLAELYIQQGIASKGIDIYRDLLQLHPDDDKIRERLAVLEEGGES